MAKLFERKIFWFVILTIIGSLFLSSPKVLAAEGFGAEGAKQAEDYSLEEMLVYAIQDEYLARAEYELIMNEYGEERPFSNIIRAEEYHIQLLIPLFEKYNITVPKDTSNLHIVLPAYIEAALQTGVEAEVANIEMYEKFLTMDLPEDIAEVLKS